MLCCWTNVKKESRKSNSLHTGSFFDFKVPKRELLAAK